MNDDHFYILLNDTKGIITNAKVQFTYGSYTRGLFHKRVRVSFHVGRSPAIMHVNFGANP